MRIDRLVGFVALALFSVSFWIPAAKMPSDDRPTLGVMVAWDLFQTLRGSTEGSVQITLLRLLAPNVLFIVGIVCLEMGRPLVGLLAGVFSVMLVIDIIPLSQMLLGGYLWLDGIGLLGVAGWIGVLKNLELSYRTSKQAGYVLRGREAPTSN